MIVLITLLVVHNCMVGPTPTKLKYEYWPLKRLTFVLNGWNDPYVALWWSSMHPHREVCGSTASDLSSS